MNLLLHFSHARVIQNTFIKLGSDQSQKTESYHKYCES